MPLICPHCHAQLPTNSTQCYHCGKLLKAPVDEAGGGLDPQTKPDPQAESDRRFPVWRILPWTMLAAMILLFLPRLLHPSHTVKPATAASSAAPEPVQPAVSAATAPALPLSTASVPLPAASIPLTVTLYSASSGKHIQVGTPVIISAYTSLPSGQSVTLAVSYGKGNSPKSLLSLAQGSLSSTTWTPLTPGQYNFSASALNSRKDSAFSHQVSIWVDAPPAKLAQLVKPVPVLTAAKPKPAPVKPKSVHVAAKPKQIAAKPKQIAAKPKQIAAKPKQIAVRPKRAMTKPPVSKTVAPQAYHVAAATFVVRGIAETLAGALRKRGFHAFVRVSGTGKHSRTYRVETGDFTQNTDAQNQVRLLKQDGYPANVFQIR